MKVFKYLQDLTRNNAMRGFGASLVCTALAAAFPSSGAALQTSAVGRTPLPKPAGSHSVGVRRFAWTDTSRLEWDTLSGIKNAFEVNVVGAEHRSFMDAFFLRPASKASPADPVRVLGIVSTYTRAFFDQYLFAKPSALLRGPAAVYPDVHLRVLRPLCRHGQIRLSGN